jgi:plastocyanin
VTRLALLVVSAFAAFTAHSTPARVGIGATEFHLVLSRASVKAGRVVLEFQNDGEDVHDLRLRRIGEARTYAFRLTKPGARSTRTLKMLPGRYRLWCSVADHAQLGMRAVLRVRR